MHSPLWGWVGAIPVSPLFFATIPPAPSPNTQPPPPLLHLFLLFAPTNLFIFRFPYIGISVRGTCKGTSIDGANYYEEEEEDEEEES